MTQPTRSVPETGQLWISRPFSIFARVLGADRALGRIEYELIDLDGSPLGEPITAALDDSWWQLFRPLQRRIG